MDADTARAAIPTDAALAAANDGGRLPAGPPVEVTPAGADALQFHGSDVCLINESGDIQCRNLPPVWKPYRKGPFKAMALYNQRGCAIRPDDSAVCWSDSDSDTLCPGAVSSCIADGRAPAEKFARLSIYAQTACGVTLDGRLLCWGAKSDARSTPPAGNDFVSVTLASSVSCALRRDGSAVCWAPSSSSGAASISGQGKQLGIGDSTICMLDNDGSVDCVGTYSDLKLDKQAHDLAQISVDRYAMCGLTQAGAARCWSLQSDTFTRVLPPVGPFKSILATPQYACGLRGDGQMECWGYFWGNGSSPETCLLGQARLSLDGQPERQESLAGFTDDRFPADAGLRSGVSSDYGYLLVDGRDAHGRDLRSATADAGSVSARGSLWMLGESDTSPGDVYCSGADGSGRIQRSNDELLVDFSDLALLGKCPGSEPVVGSLSACFNVSPCASTALTGSLRGETKNVAQRYEDGSGLAPTIGFADGSILVAHQQANEAKWGVLITAPDAAGQSEVLCAGSVSRTSAGVWTLGDFTTLGRCNGSGTHTLKGCLR